MRLLNVYTLKFREYYDPIPAYAIASHRWKSGTEASIEDVRHMRNVETEGYRKILGFTEYVKTHLPHIVWLWIDTCCINQDSDRELSEAINSMFKWYRNAEICLAYLSDVHDLKSFENSIWMRRGWTLQELIAPQTVLFLTQAWEVIGYKGETGLCRSGIEINPGCLLNQIIANMTRIPEDVLNDFRNVDKHTINEKLEWINGRQTLREEDMSYSLLGIFGVTMPIIYGEGNTRARKRLLEEVVKEDASVAGHLEDSLMPARDITNNKHRKIPETKDYLESLAAGANDPMLIQALNNFAAARQKYSHVDLFAARNVCSQALDEISQIQEGPRDSLHELVRLFHALVSASIGEPKTIKESERLLLDANVDELQRNAIDRNPEPLALNKMVIVCWIYYRLENVTEAETFCRNLITHVDNWNSGIDLFYDLNILLAFIVYSQHKSEEGSRIVRAIPRAYLQSKYDSIASIKQHSAESLLSDVLMPGCEAAAIHFSYHGDERDHPRLALEAAKRGKVSIMAMLISKNTVNIVLQDVCASHETLVCVPGTEQDDSTISSHKCDLQSPWLIATAREDNRMLQYILEELKDSTIDPLFIGIRFEETAKACSLATFQVLLEWEMDDRLKGRGLEQFEYLPYSTVLWNALDKLKFLLTSRVYSNIDQPVSGLDITPLALACSYGRENMVQLLVEYGASPEGAGYFAASPIHQAVKAGSVRTVELLLNHGAEMNRYCLIHPKDLDLVPNHAPELFPSGEQGIMLTPIQHAVILYIYGGRARTVRMIEYLLSRGADCMQSLDLGHNCVYLAVRHSRSPLVKCLVDANNHIDIDRPFHGLTVLQGVMKLPWPDVDLVQCLVANGADPGAVYTDGQTCFHRAILNHDAVALLQALHTKEVLKTTINKKDNAGQTAADLVEKANGEYLVDGLHVNADKARRHIVAALRNKPKSERSHGANVLNIFRNPSKIRGFG